jgi:hypothetical protein
MEFSRIYTAPYLMTDNDQEILSAAENMIERYGDSALQEVDLRVLELESRNQQEALRLWYEIREKVRLMVNIPTDNTKH